MPTQLKLSTDGEPELNVELDDLFVPEDSGLPNDYMDVGSDDTGEFKSIVDQSRDAWASEIDKDNENGKDNNPEHNPAQQVGPYKQGNIATQVRGFASHKTGTTLQGPVVARVIVPRGVPTLTGCTVTMTPRGKTSSVLKGRIISVGNREFSVIWSDKKASTEEKKDYILTIVR
jgi:hypothetical protein